MYPRNSVFSRPSRGHNSQEWSQTQDSQEWIDTQDIRVPTTPQIRQIIRNNNQVVPTSHNISRAQNGVNSTLVDVATTEDAREIVARDLRFGLHMMLNLIKELPEQMKQDVSEAVRSQSSQELNIKEHLESLISNIEEKLNKLLENTDNSQTLQTSLSQKEEMILSLQGKIGQLEESNNQEQKDWFIEELQGIRKELKKQLKRCQQEITNIPKESGLQNCTEVIAAQLQAILQEKFMNLSKDNKMQMEIVQRNMEEYLNDMKSLLSTKIDEHYKNIKEMLPEVVAQQVKSLERSYSRPSPLSDISNRFINPASLNTSHGPKKDHFYTASPVAAVKPLVKKEPETPRNVLRTANNMTVPSSCEYQRSSIAKNVRKPIRVPQTLPIPYKRVPIPEVDFKKTLTNQKTNESSCKKSKYENKKVEPQRILIQDTQQFDFQISSELTQSKDKKLDVPACSSDSEEESGLSIYLLSDDEDNTNLQNISTAPSKNPDENLPVCKIATHSNSISNIKHVQPVQRTRINCHIQNSSDSNKKLTKAANEEIFDQINDLSAAAAKSNMVRKVNRESFRFFTIKNRRNSYS